MYFSDKNNFFHGLTFHHFHDNKMHKKGQGSIDKDDFYKLIKFVGSKNILDAEEFLNRYKENKLKEKNLCITFDDNLKSQNDIALPILEDFNIKGFFFVCSSIFEEKPHFLEIYRYFRNNSFSKINEFYSSFFNEVDKDLNYFFNENEQKIKNYKKKFPFYSIEDVKFRLVRDELINPEDYKNIMIRMFKKKNFDFKKCYSNLYLNKNDLIKLKELGHLIGLHSHTHPMKIEKLSIEEQKEEYEKNIDLLSKAIKCEKKEIKSMAHPSGSYNQETLDILKNLEIEIGFKPVMHIEPERKMKKINNSALEIARQDHAEIMKKIN